MFQRVWMMLAGGMLLSLAVGCASTDISGQTDQNYDFSQVQRVAVVAIEGAGGSEAAQNQVGAMFNESLLRKGYSPVERSQVREIMDEQDFAQSDRTSAEGAAEAGRILNVDAALTVNVPEYGDTTSISVQMIDVETAAILWTASGSSSTGGGLSEDLGTLLGGAGGAAAGSEAGGTVGAVVGAGAGAAGGNIAGRALTPQEQEQAAELVVELSDTLPDRP